MAHQNPNALREAVWMPGRLVGGATGERAPGPATVLVADADACLRDIFATFLGHHGYRAVEAADGIEALELARGLRPDAMILDMDVPHLDGLAVTRLLQQDPATACTAVVLLSVRSAVLARLEARRAGGHGFLEKPFAPHELLAEVRRVLEPARAPLAPA